MVRGIAYVVTACFIWGLIYVVPQFMAAFGPIEVAIGRYGCFGLVSAAYMLLFRWKALCQIPWSLWKKALLYGSLANIGFYPAAVLCMRWSSCAISALILGMSPVCIVLYGNWKQRECSYSKLIYPCLATFIGLILVNIPAMETESALGFPPQYLLGLLFGFISLASWTIYAVANSRLLLANPSINAGDWCSAIGIATLLWVVVIAGALAFFVPGHYLHKFSVWTPELQSFLLGSLVLGVMCSWIGFFLWNKGCGLLPVSLAGQLTIFETLFGLLFVYALEQRIPPFIEFAGVAFMLAGIYASIKVFKRGPHAAIEPERP